MMKLLQKTPVLHGMPIIVLTLLLPSLVSCRTQQPINTEQAQTLPRPAVNPKPQQVVKIHGRLPKQLNLVLGAEYWATTPGPACDAETATWDINHGMRRQRITDLMEIRRKGVTYETELIVDKYPPGACGWKYSYTSEVITKLNNSKDDGTTDMKVISAERYVVDDSVPRCRPWDKSCTEEMAWRLRNAKDIPVLVRCQTLPAGETSWSGPYGPNFTCQDPLNDSYKKGHLLKPDTRQIQIDVYDLDNEKDPVKLSTQP
jgi:hypothetical protein